jgi:hypothetical protein
MHAGELPTEAERRNLAKDLERRVIEKVTDIGVDHARANGHSISGANLGSTLSLNRYYVSSNTCPSLNPLPQS